MKNKLLETVLSFGDTDKELLEKKAMEILNSKDRDTRRIDECKRYLVQYTQEIETMEKNLLNYAKDQKIAKHALENYSDKTFKKNVKKDLAKLKTADAYLVTNLFPNYEYSLIIKTPNLKIQPIQQEGITDKLFVDQVGKDIGAFLIMVCFNSKFAGVRYVVTNLSRISCGVYSYPCVDKGSCCLGNIGDVITRLIREKKLGALVETLIDYVTSPIYGSPYCAWDSFWKGEHRAHVWNTLRDIKNIIGQPTDENVNQIIRLLGIKRYQKEFDTKIKATSINWSNISALCEQAVPDEDEESTEES